MRFLSAITWRSRREVTIARRHTRFIERDLPRIVHTAVGRLADMRGQQDERIRTYKETELTDPAAHDLVIRAVDANVLPVTQVPAVLERVAHAVARGVRGRRQNRLAISQCDDARLERPQSGRPAAPVASLARPVGFGLWCRRDGHELAVIWPIPMSRGIGIGAISVDRLFNSTRDIGC